MLIPFFRTNSERLFHRITCIVTRVRLFAPFLLALLGAVHSSAATVFNITGTTGNSLADTAFDSAAALWSAVLLDDVTVNIQRGVASLGSGVLASTSNNFTSYTYSQIRNALIDDATSAADMTAVDNLPSGSGVNMLINRTTNSPHGSGSATPYLDNDGDANNTTVRVANANARALGLLAPSAAIDGSINFNSTSGFTWDFDPSDGITPGAFDFVGIIAHEIGHLLGFVSGVDVLDANPGAFGDSAFVYRSVLDLYRFSILSQASGVVDWTADDRSKYFSIDGGATSIATFSTGITFGDGRQASHFQDGLGLGLLDPTAGQGELLVFTSHDILAMDVIGWNVSSTPEPSSIALGMLGLGAIAIAKRRRANAASR